MAKFKTFKDSTGKIQRISNQHEDNTSEIKNSVKKFQLDFKSVNFTKQLTTIPILVISSNDQNKLDELEEAGDKDKFEALVTKIQEEGSIFTELLNDIIVIDLNNIPEWIINHINIVPIISLTGNNNTDNVTSNFDNPKVGDIIFLSDAKHWIAKLDKDNYQIKISFFEAIVEITGLDPETSTLLPFKLDLSLKIINPRIYENVQVNKK